MEVNEEGLALIMSMGFSREEASLALEETQNNIERAADWIFSHQHELDHLLASRSGRASQEDAPNPANDNLSYSDGQPK